jgi:tight adherence protein B
VSAVLVACCVLGAVLAAGMARRAPVRCRAFTLGGAHRPVSLLILHGRGASRLHVPGRRRRDERRLASGMPDALDEVARSLRSGATLLRALQEVEGAGGPAGSALARVGARAEQGVGVAEAAAQWAETSPLSEVRAAATALTLAASGAAAPVRGVEAVAAAQRARHAASAEIRTQSAQARLSAAVLAGLPIAFTAWVAITRPDALAFLVGTPAGLTCLGLGLVLEATGVLWIAAILRELG